MSDVAKLIIRAGIAGRIGEEIVLEQDVLTIGRTHTCQLILNTTFASRRHAQILRRGELYYVRDLGSKNGTLLDSQPVQGDIELMDGAEIEIGEVVLVFVDPNVTRTFPGVATAQATLWIDESSRDVWLKGQKLEPRLSVKQFGALLYLYERVGSAVSKDELATAIWPEVDSSAVYDYQIDKMISRLRERIGKELIETVWGYGYRLVE